MHPSNSVQGLPSSQAVPFGLGAGHPVAGLQAPAAWHWSAAHVTGVPVHVPFWQVSFVWHRPLSHVAPFVLFGFEQAPVAGLQVPAVWHWSRAVHVTGVPVHVPFWQVSPVWHRPLSHVAPFVLFGFEQMPVAGLHVPAVWHWSSAVQVTGVPVHVPFWHVSPVWHRPLSHVVLFGLFWFEQAPVFASHTPRWHWSDGVHVTVSHGCAIRQTLISWIDQWFADAVPVCVIRMKRAVAVRKLIVTSCVLPVPVATGVPQLVPSLDRETE